MNNSSYTCNGSCNGCLHCEACDLTSKLQGKSISVAITGLSHSGCQSLMQKMLQQGVAAVDGESIQFANCTIHFVNIYTDPQNSTPRAVGREVAAFVRTNHPDILLNVVDSTRLEESLALTAQLIDMHMHIVVALNHYDELLATQHAINYAQLGQMMGFPATPTDALSGKGTVELLNMILGVYAKNEGIKHTHIPYGQDLENSIHKIEAAIESKPELLTFDSRYLAIRLLEDETEMLPLLGDHANEITKVSQAETKLLTRSFGQAPAILIDKARMGFVHGALTETLIHSKDNSDHTFLQKLDAILTNRWLGIPLLCVVLFLVFECTFMLGAYPQRWIDGGINMLADRLRGALHENWFSSMLIDGVVMGVGAVLAFLPNIMILFLFLSVLEDIGYMSRAAFVMDKIMHKIGLHGRSFIPMLIGFGCNVPAIMAARSIDNPKNRTLTMLMIPFMSCSARLPVYMLFVSAFFAQYKALVMMSLYIIGILFAILFAFIMKQTRFFKQEQDDYVSELPSFRRPTLRNTWAHIWERTSDYLKKISTVILAASVIIWALEYFPADRTNQGANKEESYLAMIGQGMEPIMRPLGFDWKMNVCILTGLPAKEAIVSTMGILYHVSDDDEGSLTQAMQDEIYTSGPRAGQHVFTPAVSWAFMLFVLLYFPCIATIATLKREVGRGWAAFTVVHSLLLAWVVAFAVFQIGSLIL